MNRSAPVFLIAVVLLVTASCSSTPHNLEKLDLSPTKSTDNLVIEARSLGNSGLSTAGIVKGAGEGALTGMGNWTGGFGGGGSGGDPLAGAVLAAIWVVGLPISAGVGAAMAHSEEEIQAARASLYSVLHEDGQATVQERKFIEALGGFARSRWDCVQANSISIETGCQPDGTTTRILLEPIFRFALKGEFNPDVLFDGRILVTVSIDYADGALAVAEPLLKAKWAYHEELGTFFKLAENDGSLFRKKLDLITDRFAHKIAKDMYLNPQAEHLKSVQKFGGATHLEYPEAMVVRIDQGTQVVSARTHGNVMAGPLGRTTQICWIEALNGKRTGHDRSSAQTLAWNRKITVRAGLIDADVSCVSNPGSDDEKLKEYSIEIPVEAGRSYSTDGQAYKEIRPFLQVPYFAEPGFEQIPQTNLGTVSNGKEASASIPEPEKLPASNFCDVGCDGKWVASIYVEDPITVRTEVPIEIKNRKFSQYFISGGTVRIRLNGEIDENGTLKGYCGVSASRGWGTHGGFSYSAKFLDEKFQASGLFKSIDGAPNYRITFRRAGA